MGLKVMSTLFQTIFFQKINCCICLQEPSPLLQKATEEPYLDDQDEDASRPESAENANFPFREELSLDSIPDITPKEKKKVRSSSVFIVYFVLSQVSCDAI